jgi:hypothetical protein
MLPSRPLPYKFELLLPEFFDIPGLGGGGRPASDGGVVSSGIVVAHLVP